MALVGGKAFNIQHRFIYKRHLWIGVYCLLFIYQFYLITKSFNGRCPMPFLLSWEKIAWIGRTETGPRFMEFLFPFKPIRISFVSFLIAGGVTWWEIVYKQYRCFDVFFFNEKENKFLTYFIHTYMYLYVCTIHICIDASSPMPSLVCICLLYSTHSIVVFRKIHTCHMWILHFLFIFCVEFVIWSDFDFVWNKIIAAPIYL